jgi:hypothetical protein
MVGEPVERLVGPQEKLSAIRHFLMAKRTWARRMQDRTPGFLALQPIVHQDRLAVAIRLDRIAAGDFSDQRQAQDVNRLPKQPAQVLRNGTVAELRHYSTF